MSKKVILLFGGNSEERLVSVASAQNLAANYDFSEFVFQDKSEKLYSVSREELMRHADVFTKEFVPATNALAITLEQFAESLTGKVLFLALHGAQGENGKLQGMLESKMVCFTGAGAEASRLAFEKHLAKEVMAHTGNLLPEQIRFNSALVFQQKPALEKLLAKHGKIVLKPTSSGSSFGLFMAGNIKELDALLPQIEKSEFKSYLAENFISGRELTVGVMQDGSELLALPASEIILNEGRAFDYEGKYLGAGSTEITPAKLSDAELLSAQRLALDAHLAFGAYGYSRTDMILTEKGPYFLETNTLPGLSKPSFFPQQLLAADIGFKHFIEAQIILAERRYEAD
jgi:D-alanine-D-alanine ligase